MTDSVAELRTTFELFDDWAERYQYLIELGAELEPLAAEHKIEANRVQGCQSQVWLIARIDPGQPPTIHVTADSDSQIVRGLIAVLLRAYSDKTPAEILAFDIQALFAELGLKQHLSRSRSNGFFSMVQRIRSIAEQAQAA